jgi:hypothetical protein
MKQTIMGGLLFLASLPTSATTYIQHIIKNNTPHEFYYTIIPATESPSAYSCNCFGVIAPKETHTCECYSALEAQTRRYRMEYMKNISPTVRESVSHSAESDVKILWEFTYDSYWEWIKVYPVHMPIA